MITRQRDQPMWGYRQSVGGTNVSLIVRGLSQRMRFRSEPALSFVPERRAPTEGLLTDDRAGRLVIHVEVARGVAEPLRGVLDCGTVLGEHGSGERERDWSGRGAPTSRSTANRGRRKP